MYGYIILNNIPIPAVLFVVSYEIVLAVKSSAVDVVASISPFANKVNSVFQSERGRHAQGRQSEHYTTYRGK